jgi:hypothetical protein
LYRASLARNKRLRKRICTDQLARAEAVFSDPRVGAG